LAQKKHKKKDKVRGHSSPHHSLKRGRASTFDVETNKGGQLLSSDFAFHKGVNISLTTSERGALPAASKEELLANCLEL